MIPMSEGEAREKIIACLKKYGLPVTVDVDEDTLISYIFHDKKMDGDEITVIYCKEIGAYEMRKIKAQDIKSYLNGGVWE